MKKKMIALVVLVFAVAITSYSVSGTYAKYTSTKTGTDKARVAIWGIDVTNDVSLFKSSLVEGTDGINATSKYSDNIIAPGSKGSYTFKIEGNGTNAPEVDYTLKIEATGNITDASLKKKMKFQLDNKGGSEEDASHYYNIDELLEKINALDTGSKHAAGSTVSTSEHTISWLWDFETTSKESDDVTDTTLGNSHKDISGAESVSQPDVTLTVTITAEQIKKANA